MGKDVGCGDESISRKATTTGSELASAPSADDRVPAGNRRMHGDLHWSQARCAGPKQPQLVAAGDQTLAAAIDRAENLLIAIMFGLEGEPSRPTAIEPKSIASARFGEAIRIDAPPSRSPPRATRRQLGWFF